MLVSSGSEDDRATSNFSCLGKRGIIAEYGLVVHDEGRKPARQNLLCIDLSLHLPYDLTPAESSLASNFFSKNGDKVIILRFISQLFEPSALVKVLQLLVSCPAV